MINGRQPVFSQWRQPMAIRQRQVRDRQAGIEMTHERADDELKIYQRNRDDPQSGQQAVTIISIRKGSALPPTRRDDGGKSRETEKSLGKTRMNDGKVKL